MAVQTASSIDRVTELLGDEAESLLGHRSTTVDASTLHLPGPDFVDRIYAQTDRNNQVLRNLQGLFDHGRLGGTGYVSILPVDQGIEHSAGASFAPNPRYFDPENIVELAHEGGCNAVASTLGVLGAVSRKWAHKIPFIVKINHNELLRLPNQFDQVEFSSVKRAWELGATGVGATIYFGSEQSTRQLVEIARAFEEAHRLGMYTVLWCYLRNSGFKKDGVDYHVAADLTAQANHLGVTIEADIIKQKLPENNGGYTAIGGGYGKTHKLVYEQLTTDHPIDLTRYQVLNCYSGRAGLINSGGASSGASDLAEAVKTAVINKRAGGTGLISGRKAFQRPVEEGVALLNAIQDVYLDPQITIA
ncbi:Fructose-bisphosphate aldolase class I [Patulibacter medicamentivorans]|uniref:fructose-bisphosphate aldolase n=1 Tax=Patulibacter medicamentivorans TaxID=1097667 RepID=H0EAQ3_9ACTN|nr:class I fructose-bisphosphate aldolase [Patulibacter medicamentivorans]EHN09228.1 Fructose-bisphosphate aldolase class I [Patulibacter medicamentivorans]